MYGPAAFAFTCPTGGAPTAQTFGFVILNTTGDGRLVGEVSMKRATPNTYGIYVNQDPGKCPTTATYFLTTNNQGNGNVHIDEPRVPSATSFWISAVGPDPNTAFFQSPAVVLD